jgi:hypothetical protein
MLSLCNARMVYGYAPFLCQSCVAFLGCGARLEVTAQAAPDHFVPGEVTDNDRWVAIGEAFFAVVSGSGVQSVSNHVLSE